MAQGNGSGRRPEWAAAGTFSQAWRAASLLAAGASVPWLRGLNANVLAGLGPARVITIDTPQVQALPTKFDTYATSAAAFLDTHLPFDPVYLSVGDVPLWRFGEGEDDSVRPHLLGALVGRPALRADDLPGWDREQPLIFPFLWVPALHGGRAMEIFDRLVFAARRHSEHGEGSWMAVSVMDQVGPPAGVDAAAVEAERTIGCDSAEIIAAVLYMLESANVELVDAPATRQERRAVERKGGRVALAVRVRPPKKRPRQDDDRRHIDFSHRFEVRGHYKHFPVGTKLADSRPDKCVDHPTLGRCRRIWCPPFVKGPEDKPLIPKVRVVA